MSFSAAGRTDDRNYLPVGNFKLNIAKRAGARNTHSDLPHGYGLFGSSNPHRTEFRVSFRLSARDRMLTARIIPVRTSAEAYARSCTCGIGEPN